MTGYSIANLSVMMKTIPEERIKEILSSFSCSQNPDVERFLKLKSIEFARQGIAATHLVFTSYKEDVVLIGYFTLSNKSLYIGKNAVGSNLRKRISRFAIKSPDEKGMIITAPLIGQLGKNFANGYNELITGDELLKLACDTVKEGQLIFGGKAVYLECADNENLIAFYSRNGFHRISDRALDKIEREENKCNYLVQFIKYL